MARHRYTRLGMFHHILMRTSIWHRNFVLLSFKRVAHLAPGPTNGLSLSMGRSGPFPLFYGTIHQVWNTFSSIISENKNEKVRFYLWGNNVMLVQMVSKKANDLDIGRGFWADFKLAYYQ